MSTPTFEKPAPARNPGGLRKMLLVILALVVVAGVAGGGYGLWYILLGPTSPAAVSSVAPAVPSGANVTLQAATGSAGGSLDGTWNVNNTLGSLGDGTSSFAGYRVQEQLVGVGGHTAVGRTAKVTGSIALAGTVVSNVQITVDMTSLTSDDSHRDDQLTHQAIETANFPTSSFKTTAPIDLTTLPAEGVTITVNAAGDLTLHGVTKPVTISLQATRQGGIIAVAGSVPILFSDYNVQKPTSFSLLSVDDHGIMELHLLFTHA
jgi:polyisoprenoid-binding protein YceI